MDQFAYIHCTATNKLYISTNPHANEPPYWSLFFGVYMGEVVLPHPSHPIFARSILHGVLHRCRWCVFIGNAWGKWRCRTQAILYYCFHDTQPSPSVPNHHHMHDTSICMYINCANSRCHLGKWRCHTRLWYPIPCRLLLYCRLH